MRILFVCLLFIAVCSVSLAKRKPIRQEKWWLDERSSVLFQNSSVAAVQIDDFEDKKTDRTESDDNTNEDSNEDTDDDTDDDTDNDTDDDTDDDNDVDSNEDTNRNSNEDTDVNPNVDSNDDSNDDEDTDEDSEDKDETSDDRDLLDTVDLIDRVDQDLSSKTTTTKKPTTTTKSPKRVLDDEFKGIDFSKFFLQEKDFVNTNEFTKTTDRDSPLDNDWTQPTKNKFQWVMFRGNVVAPRCSFPTHSSYKEFFTRNTLACGSTCTKEPKCTHFSYAQDKCKLYGDKVKRDDADVVPGIKNMVASFCGFSGVKAWSQEKLSKTQIGCNFLGKPEQIVSLKSSKECAQMCHDRFPNCTHYVAKPGSCVLKKGKPMKIDAFLESLTDFNSHLCGILNKQCDQVGCE